MRTTCCLNLPPPTSNQAFNTPLPIRPAQLPLAKNEGGHWRKQCILMKMVCTLIGFEMGNLVSSGGEEGIALAHNATLPFPLPVVSASERKAAKWSEKRACPPWRHNSLETVVPENLPRPAARRRYEAVRSSNSKTAPSLSLPVQTKTDCFSM